MSGYHKNDFVWYRVGQPFLGETFSHPAHCGYGFLRYTNSAGSWIIHTVWAIGAVAKTSTVLANPDDLYPASWTFHGPMINQTECPRRWYHAYDTATPNDR